MTDFSIVDVDHIEVSVKDREKSAKWYEEIFGLKPVQELEMWSKIGPLFIGNEDGSVKLALFNGVKDTDGSINRIAFSTAGEKFLDFLNRVDSLNLLFIGKKVTKEHVVDHDLSYSLYFDDPDGNKLELTCYDHNYLKLHIKSARRFD
ncbi:VOC family protein [Nitrosopumilus sp.]|uniref:VOC family protein n=1 Tax=Nitrosopumilus sp. TaxID=2024843 RepID=UPI0026301595|nr:VOC family protein [Nitrosopumilus sp.]